MLAKTKFLDIEYLDISDMKLIGLSRRTSLENIFKVWGIAFENGIFNKLNSFEEKIITDIGDYVGIGYIDKIYENKDVQYTVGKLVKKDIEVDELDEIKISKGKIAKVYIEAKSILNITKEEIEKICIKAIEDTGYKVDCENFYICDVYTYEGYVKNLRKSSNIVIEYLVPVLEN